MFGALAQGLGSIVSGIGQAVANKKQRAFDTQMYEKQKADNLEMWNLNNQYNTPEAVMQRLKQAGLNPNLAYGQGAQWQAQSPQKADAQNTNVSGNISGMLRELPGNMANMVNQVYDLRIKSAQADNLKASTENMQSQTKLNFGLQYLKHLEAIKMRTDNEYQRKKLDIEIAQLRQNLNNSVLTGLNIGQNTRTQATHQEQMKNDILMALDQNKRAWQLQKPTIDKIQTDIAKTIQDIVLSKSQLNLNNWSSQIYKLNYIKGLIENEMKGHERDFMEKGYTIQSGAIDQVLKQLLQALGYHDSYIGNFKKF